MDLSEFCRQIHTEFAVNNPGWWIIITKYISKNLPTQHQEELTQFLQNITTIMITYCKNWTRWENRSFSIVLENLYDLHGDICQMSLSQPAIETLKSAWKRSTNMANLSEEACSHELQMATTYTSSMTALTPTPVADAFGENESNLLRALNALVPSTNPGTSFQNGTGTMSSSISFLRNGEIEKYGLEEQVGKYRLTLNWYDGEKSIQLGERWYDSKIAGIQMSVSNPQIIMKVEELILLLQKMFIAKRPTKCENSRTLNKRRRHY